MEYLDVEDLIGIMSSLRCGPVRDVGLLDSAAHRPQASVFGDDAYTTIEEKAAVLADSIVRDHPLVDGNKRLALAAMLTFLDLNGVIVDTDRAKLLRLTVDLAAGAISWEDLARELEHI